MSNRYTSLSRGVDLRYSSNRFILLLSCLAAVIFALLAGQAKLEGVALLEVVAKAFIAPFVIWAIAREVNPDRVWVANLSAILTVFAYIFLWPMMPLLTWELFLVMLMMRVVTRTVGVVPTWIDLIVLAFLAIVIALVNMSWLVVALVAAALTLDALLGDDNEKSLWAGAFLALSAVVLWYISPSVISGKWEVLDVAIMFILAAVSLGVTFLRPGKLQAKADIGNKSLSLRRINAARALFVTSLVLLSLHSGVAASLGLVGGWVVVVIVVVGDLAVG